jgi:hypothetical protein
MPPPVPNISAKDFHYYPYFMCPDEFQDVEHREVGDFCPRTQLNKLLASCGDVFLASEERDGSLFVTDVGEKWLKITQALPECIASLCGDELAEAAWRYVEASYLREVKRAVVKKTKKVVSENDLVAIKTGPLRMKLKRI